MIRLNDIMMCIQQLYIHHRCYHSNQQQLLSRRKKHVFNKEIKKIFAHYSLLWHTLLRILFAKMSTDLLTKSILHQTFTNIEYTIIMIVLATLCLKVEMFN